MAVKSFGVNASGVASIAEGAGPTALFAAVQTAMDDALAVTDIGTITGATAAITAIGAASDDVEAALIAQPITLLIDGALSKAQIFKALDAFKAHLDSNSLYS